MTDYGYWLRNSSSVKVLSQHTGVHLFGKYLLSIDYVQDTEEKILFSGNL